MDTNFSLGLVIGATLSNTVGSAFKTLESKFKSLETKSQNIALTKALHNKLKSYENTIANLQKQREEYIKLGKTTEEIDRKLDLYKQKLKGVKLEAVRAGISIKDLREDTEKLGETLQKTKAKMQLGEMSAKLSTDAMKLGGVVATGTMTIGAVIKPAIDFESAFADVKKVVDFASKEQEKQFQKTLLDLSTKIPLSAVELAQIAAQGGQLGIDVKNLPQFTQLVAKMSTAFDMLPAQAGEAFAKLSNIYKLSMKEAGELADAINYLGNNTAAKERDIINVLARIGGIAKQFGLAKEQAAALADAFIALGKSPEEAGTAINAILGKLNTIDSQSKQFKQAFSQVIPIEQFKELKKQDPQKALFLFLTRLKQLDKETQANLISQMFGTEYADEVSLLVGSLHQYAKALKLVSEKEKYRGALEREAQAKMQTTQANIQILVNKINRMAIVIGSFLLPPLNEVVWILGEIVGTVANFIQEHETLGKVISYSLVGIFGLGAALLLTRMAFTAGNMALLAYRSGLLTLQKASLATATATKVLGVATAFLGNTVFPAVVAKGGMVIGALKAFTMRAIFFSRALMLANPLGFFGLLATGLAAGAYLVITHWDKIKQWFGKLWDWIKAGFKKVIGFLGKVLEYSPIGMLMKAGSWIGGKIASIFHKKEENIKLSVSETKSQNVERRQILDRKTYKKIEQKLKTYRVDFGELKVHIEGEVKGNVDEDTLDEKIAAILEEKVNRKVQEVLRQIQEDNMRRAY